MFGFKRSEDDENLILNYRNIDWYLFYLWPLFSESNKIRFHSVYIKTVVKFVV